MGFLKFLKKKKKEEAPLDVSLDVPPLPPSTKKGLPKPGFEEKLPKEFPKFEFKKERPIVTEEKLPKAPKEKELGLEVPSFPPLEERPEFVPKPPMKEPIKEISLPKEELIKPELEESVGEKIEAVVREERKPVRKGPTYIRLDKFKGTLRDVNVIRSNLKKSDEVLRNLIESKEEKAIDFERWYNTMEDIQKKLIFIEKTLFKGD